MPLPSTQPTPPAAPEPPARVMPEREKYAVLLCFAALLLALGFCFNSPAEIWTGSLVILTSPANLVTDYFALANVGAALFNASLITLLSIAMAWLNRAKLTGGLIAAIFTVAGFSLFGKNLYNTLPIVLGVACYAKLIRARFQDHMLVAFFGTALGPLVSEITFNLGLPLPLGVGLGTLAGLGVGMVLCLLSAHFMRFHQGFNLYNIGFTCGIVGTFFIALLRLFGVEVAPVSLVSGGYNQPFALALYLLCVVLFVLGLACNRWNMKGYGALLRESGKLPSDFLAAAGFGLTLVNMGLLGAIGTTYVLLVGGELSGPVIGGIFTMMGFGAYGKHIKNVAAVLLGIFLMGMLGIGDVFSTGALLAALFGTTLAPIAGQYGPVAGVVAGALHMALVMNIGDLHAGMNLYNNGFSGGFIAASMVPLLEGFLQLKQRMKDKSGTMDGECE